MAKTINLKHKATTLIKPVPPYNFDPTVFKPSHYPDPLKLYKPGKYWFVLRLGERVYGIKLVSQGTITRPKIQVNIFSRTKLPKKEIRKIIGEINYRFEFQRDISEFFRKFKKDRVLSPYLKRWYGMHGSCAQDLYGLLMIAIFLQNTVIKRSVQMTKVMLEKYGIRVKFDSRTLYYFWTPKEIINVPEKELRNLKVGYRAKLFIRTSKTFIEEKISEQKLRKMSIEEAKNKLLKIYGVGPETARILLVEALHYYDIFEHVAPWQQKIYSRLLFNKKLVSTNRIIKYVKNKWGEWANLATSYIWEDIFWQRKMGRKIGWLEKEVRL